MGQLAISLDSSWSVNIDARAFARLPITEHVSVHELGSQLIGRLAAGAGLFAWSLRTNEVLALALNHPDATLEEAVALITAHLTNTAGYASLTNELLLREIGRFGRQMQFLKVRGLQDVTPWHASEFISGATLRAGVAAEPSLDTQHARRNTVRTFFRGGRQIGLTSQDPARDIVLPPRSSSRTRPLTDEEVLLCEVEARHTLFETRQPAAIALGEATASNAEIAVTLAGDVDLPNARVWLRGSARQQPRWGSLTPWGVDQIARRLEVLDGDPARGLVHAGVAGGLSGRVSSCNAVRTVLYRAGLAAEPDIKPASLRAWAGTRVWSETHDVRAVRDALGVGTLDTAARIIQLGKQ